MVKLFGYIITIGEQMLLSGAEVHRVEESISRMGLALGAERVDVFIITSSMVVTFHLKNGETYTQTRRIVSASTDFEKLHKLNELSRNICNGNLTETDIKKQLSKISALKKLPVWVEIICYSVIAGAFTLFFGGTITESVFSLLIGAIVRTVIYFSEKVISNKVFSKFISSAVITFLAFLLVSLKLIPDVDKTIIGNIMTLIPGSSLYYTMASAFSGNLELFVQKAISTLQLASSLALGVILSAAITKIFFKKINTNTKTEE